MIPILNRSGRPLYEQLYEFFRDAILEGRIQHGDRLPSYRILSRELQVGRNTVVRAYEQLTLEGYLVNENRKGLYAAKLDVRERHSELAFRQSRRGVAKRTANPSAERFNSSVHMVDESNFPVAQWRKCSNWALDNISFQYQEHEREDPLKTQLIPYLFHHRGVQVKPEQIIIGSGASVLVFWLAVILRKTCSDIMVEDPGYPRIQQVFSECGYIIKALRVKKDGVDPDKLAGQTADLLYLTPSHQFPTGVSIPVQARLRILHWARENNAYIIEDDFDCEFRHKAKLMPALQGLDRDDRVIYLGSFSNSLMPSLRVAYLVLPQKFSVDYQSYAYLMDTVPYVIRKTLACFMEEGFWERHLKRMRKVYKSKYDRCVRALEEMPAELIHFNRAPSGLNIWLRINTVLSETEVVERAAAQGVHVTAGSYYYRSRSNSKRRPEVLFEFGSLPEDQIEGVVRKLGLAWSV
ncbi:PLP-dependent aminotransferase family protein [Fulvivirgaceae bacterium PWU5]|uniref:PLP-dependent aminotransferase family protein n=1 Tax=Dawidia cretensis TaxID=2782350 RepID=A0AAP2GNB2_9BACT|nr:PLP-dependent aminotransferase family protein [Dawidia cretensis]MBT1707336.1 PLP-dependent aminotransferase family protein [Dawidia cretensis]